MSEDLRPIVIKRIKKVALPITGAGRSLTPTSLRR